MDWIDAGIFVTLTMMVISFSVIVSVLFALVIEEID